MEKITSSIVLTEEQIAEQTKFKQEALQKRVNDFSADLKKIIEKHQLDLAAELTYLPTGITAKVVVVDIKK